VFAAGAAGSIAGVFLTGYVLLDVMGVTAIFRLVGIVVMMLGLLALNLDWPRGESEGV
jgi:phage-related minor tail protein